MKKRRQILRKIKDKDGTFMTGAGLQLDEISDDETKAQFIQEDHYDDIMSEIKRDVLKWKNVRISPFFTLNCHKRLNFDQFDKFHHLTIFAKFSQF